MWLIVTLILFMVSSCLFAVAVALQFLSPVQSSGCKLECDRSRFGGQNIYFQPCFAQRQLQQTWKRYNAKFATCSSSNAEGVIFPRRFSSGLPLLWAWYSRGFRLHARAGTSQRKSFKSIFGREKEIVRGSAGALCCAGGTWWMWSYCLGWSHTTGAHPFCSLCSWKVFVRLGLAAKLCERGGSIPESIDGRRGEAAACDCAGACKDLSPNSVSICCQNAAEVVGQLSLSLGCSHRGLENPGACTAACHAEQGAWMAILQIHQVHFVQTPHHSHLLANNIFLFYVL